MTVIAPDMITPETEARFWEKVDRRAANDCWPWLASRSPQGYGRFSLHSYAKARAPRVAYAIHYRVDPAERLVMHSCDNPACVNPAHLSLGTYADNNNDRIAKGRTRPQNQKGENNNGAKYSLAIIAEVVRLLLAGKSNQAISDALGIKPASVSAIRRGKCWAAETAALGWEPRPMFKRKAGAAIPPMVELAVQALLMGEKG